MTKTDRLGIDTRASGDIVTLVVTGEIDAFTASQFRETALRALSARPQGLHVDLSGVEFMDSTGLHVLIATRRRAELVGSHMAVVASRQVLRLLTLTGAVRLFSPLCPCTRPQVTTAAPAEVTSALV